VLKELKELKVLKVLEVHKVLKVLKELNVLKVLKMLKALKVLEVLKCSRCLRLGAPKSGKDAKNGSFDVFTNSFGFLALAFRSGAIFSFFVVLPAKHVMAHIMSDRVGRHRHACRKRPIFFGRPRTTGPKPL